MAMLWLFSVHTVSPVGPTLEDNAKLIAGHAVKA